MKTHPTKVEGFDGSLTKLAEHILRMRYDKVADFFCECSAELFMQSVGDSVKGRNKLARMLNEAAHLARVQEQQFRRILELCKPHMKDELASKN